MGLSERSTPVATTNRQNGELRNDDGSTNGSRDFLGGLDTQSNVTLAIANNNNSLEAGTLTGTGLFLDWLDLYLQKILISRSFPFLFPVY
jgi:hypothetical protein